MTPPAQPAEATGADQPRQSLGQLAVRGGGYLVGREAVGMIIRLVGVVLVVREIGPGPYGIYSGAAAFVLFVATFAQLGLEVYLIRMPGEVGPRQYNRAFTLLLVASVIVTAGAEAVTFAFGGFLRPIGVLVPLRVLLLSVPVNVLWAPSQASIERWFRYRAMGLLELGGDIALYATAVPLAFLGDKAWSLVAGYFAWQTWLFIGSWATSGLKLRWDWSTSAVRHMIRHGVSYSSAQWASRLADLVNPLVVGTFLGATGVGYVAFAQRLVDTIAFAKRGAYRLGMVAMSRVGDEEKGRLRYSIEEGTLLQLLSLAVPIACFGVIARWMVPVIFGHEWAKAVPVYSLLALASVLGAPLFIQTTFLFSRGRNIAATGIALVQSLCIAGTAIFLVHRFGLDGFGEAWLFGLVAIVVCDRVVRRGFTFSYRRIVPWMFILGPPVLFPLAPLPWAFLLLAPLLLVLLPPLRAEVTRITTFLRSALARRTRATVTDAALVGTQRDPATGEAVAEQGRGGVDRLLWMARTHCGAAVAFASVRQADGRFSSIALPGTAAGSAWSDEALDELVTRTWADLVGTGGPVVSDALIANPVPGEPVRQVSVAAAPLSDPGSEAAPWGMLGVAGSTGGRFEPFQLELLGNLARRLGALLRARHRPTPPPAGLAGSPPGSAGGPQSGAPLNPVTSELDVLLGPDPLTGLATLTALVGRLSTSLAQLRTNDGSVGLILIEVAEANGWQLPSSTTLIDVAGRLMQHLRERDLIARIGPTTFAILVDLLPGAINVGAIRDRALVSLSGGLAASTGELRTRSGVAWATTGTSVTAESLLRSAAPELRTQESDRVSTSASAGTPGEAQR